MGKVRRKVEWIGISALVLALLLLIVIPIVQYAEENWQDKVHNILEEREEAYPLTDEQVRRIDHIVKRPRLSPIRFLEIYYISDPDKEGLLTNSEDVQKLPVAYQYLNGESNNTGLLHYDESHYILRSGVQFNDDFIAAFRYTSVGMLICVALGCYFFQKRQKADKIIS